MRGASDGPGRLNVNTLTKPHRRLYLIATIAATMGLMLSGWAVAGDEPAEAKTSADEKHSVFDLEWIAGNWEGEIFGGPIQEMWTTPRGGSMAGVSRMGGSSKKSTYECLLIEQVDGVPTMYLRHFNSKLAAREGKDAMAYKLVSLKDKTAVFKTDDTKLSFSEISYSREGDILSVKLSGKRRDKPFTVNCTMKPVGS